MLRYIKQRTRPCRFISEFGLDIELHTIIRICFSVFQWVVRCEECHRFFGSVQSLNEHNCATNRSASLNHVESHDPRNSNLQGLSSRTTPPDSTNDHTYSAMRLDCDSSSARQSVHFSNRNTMDYQSSMDMKLDHNLNINSESQVSSTSHINGLDLSDMPVLFCADTSPERKYRTRGMRIPELEKEETSPSQLQSFVKQEASGESLQVHSPNSAKVLNKSDNSIFRCYCK